MKLPLVLTIVITGLLVSSTMALDITTLDGVTYKKCEITRVEPDALAFSHAYGMARISYENLPDALRRQYFDPAKVAAYREQLQQAQDAAAAKVAQAQRAREEAALKERQKQQRFVDEGQQEEKDRRTAMVDEQIALKEAEERPEKVRRGALAMAGIVAFGLLARMLIGKREAS